MRYFWDVLEEYGDSPALISEQITVSYRQLAQIADNIAGNIPERSLVFLLCRNQIAPVAGYAAFLRKRIVPVLLNAAMDRDLFDNLMRIYRPQYLWCPDNFTGEPGMHSYGGYKLVSTGYDRPDMNGELALLVSTSGSTGSPKLVRLSYQNIQSNTEAIAEFLGIGSEDRPVTTLPMNYVYGLSILQSHLMAGAGILMTEYSLFDGKFWELFKREGVTTFGAVPFVYRNLDRLQFLRKNLPSLRYITQAGGALGKELHYRLAQGMLENGKKLIVMYGATEATARMSYVPYEWSAEKAGSIGIAIPGGRFELVDGIGAVISENETVGELVYYGKNVMLGYAENRWDLNQGDELHGRLATGDLARRDDDGFYYIVGRKNRMLKVFGNRVNLAEVEELLNAKGYEAACTGEEDHIQVNTTSGNGKEIVDFLVEKTGLNAKAFSVNTVIKIPRTPAGKIMYSKLEKEEACSDKN